MHTNSLISYNAGETTLPRHRRIILHGRANLDASILSRISETFALVHFPQFKSFGNFLVLVTVTTGCVLLTVKLGEREKTTL